MSRSITFSLEDRVYTTLEKLAFQHGYKTGPYAKMLFEAAFASRAGAQPDPDIDAQIGVAVVLHAAGERTESISRIARLSEDTVVKILNAWRVERQL